MRVTQNMLDRNLLFAMSRNLERLVKLNEQLSTGQRVNTVSDDVIAAGQIMRLSRENDQVGVYLANMHSVDSMLSFATGTLGKVSETMTRLKELATQAATETYSATERQIMAEGVANLLDTLVALANVETRGSYVFSGEATHTAPYAVTTDMDGNVVSVDYQGAAIAAEVAVGPGTMRQANLVGREIFEGVGDLFQTLIDLRDAMRADDTAQINQLLGELTTAHTDVRVTLGRYGERQSQLHVLRTSLERLSELNTGAVSDRQDADVAEVAVQYNSMMALMQMVMKVAAEAVRPSIVNFM